MTSAEWNASTDPAAMLERLKHSDLWTSLVPPIGPVSDRKLRLFACACCRAVWDRLTDPRSRRAVEVAERFADGLATVKELINARCGALTTSNNIAANEAMHCCQTDAHWAARTIARPEDVCPAATKAAYLRAIIGDPFRPMTLDPRCRTPDVLAIATRIYADRDWDAMPMLADALETSGCEDVRVLEWLRGDVWCVACNGFGVFGSTPGPAGTLLCAPCPSCSGTGRIQPVRCRGDWCLDAILGRE